VNTNQFQPRVTVATLVPRDGRYLFVEENILGIRVLNQPAGHLDAGETLHAAAVRETLEETGWLVELTHFLGVSQLQLSDRQFIRFNFLAKPLSHDKNRILDEGIVQAIWLSEPELLAYPAPPRSDMVLATIKSYTRADFLPLDAVRSFGMTS
jgi:8-oxo-dGTP pyrophosphatase MutT (NUDIX family)